MTDDEKRTARIKEALAAAVPCDVCGSPCVIQGTTTKSAHHVVDDDDIRRLLERLEPFTAVQRTELAKEIIQQLAEENLLDSDKLGDFKEEPLEGEMEKAITAVETALKSFGV